MQAKLFDGLLKELKFNERMQRRLQEKQNIKKVIIWKTWFQLIEIMQLNGLILRRYDVIPSTSTPLSNILTL